MPTNITQQIDEIGGRIVLRVTGELMLSDAILLEKIAVEMQTETEKAMTIDFAELDFLDSESAPILRRLESEHGFALEGMASFVQTAINAAERQG